MCDITKQFGSLYTKVDNRHHSALSSEPSAEAFHSENVFPRFPYKSGSKLAQRCKEPGPDVVVAWPLRQPSLGPGVSTVRGWVNGVITG